MSTFYITTSIPYVNAAPHIGHALEFVQADVFARYHRLIGNETYFQSGSDENSLKNVQAAEREGVSTAELVDRYAQSFIDLIKALDISNDDFIRTSVEQRHIAGARLLWELCAKNGDIYKKNYRGLYCVECELFYDEEELAGGRCPDHGTVPDVVEEENYFFRLSRYQDRLAALIREGDLRIIPETRRNEAYSFVARGLEDFSISRTRNRARGWGVEVPGDPNQVMYVWFDALTNYITALGYASNEDRYRRFWQDSPNRVHAIGKGILRFHAIYWPAMLMSAGVPIPSTIFVHGYLTIDNQKISKSLGNVVDPVDLVGRYGPDAVRYWLLREVPPTDDADYTRDKLERRYTADLANDLGNLLNRSVNMLHRYRDGIVPVPGSSSSEGEDLMRIASGIAGRLRASMGDEYDPQSALVAIWEIVVRANRYAQETAPWNLAKAERAGEAGASQQLETALYHLAEALRLIGEAVRPFLPVTAERIASALGATRQDQSWLESLEWGAGGSGQAIAPAGKLLFPKIE